MKTTFTAICVLVIMALAKGDDQMIQKMIVNTPLCIQESKVAPNLVEKLKDEVFTDDPALKCFIKCMYVKVGAMSETGEFNIEELKKTMDEADEIQRIDKCKDAKGADPCETAFLMIKCTEGK